MWIGRRSNERVADTTVAVCRRAILFGFGDIVTAVFHYGAVDIDPRHLVIWVLLSTPPDATPPWCRDPELSDDQSINAELRHRLVAVQALIRTAFADAGWPAADRVTVGFESDARVRDGGGWNYFR